ncbi:ABC transporter ATP-binding protein [Pelotalea chapellei]|uniref:ABC transporter ATP-binding protein n=1 Tax=Pelotalea chapellei TaxID=44671 RepID=A0ABS5U4C2_9BACT|nr:ABC transporter ATP-binding protein [Pelotalea chapellei]MBT1070511.1 ABC transporter ATP-binding protein [Pelotalea chapellei]
MNGTSVSTTGKESVLDIRGLTRRFQVNGSEVTALQNINLSVRQGEFISVIGGSGCGKSTLLRIIAGLDTEYEGEALFDGARIKGPGLERGVVFQEHRLFPWLTVRQNVAFGLGNVTSKDDWESVDEHIELVGLKDFEGAYPHQLSGGMAQRASIARALANRPEALLLDEPFGALDALTKIQMQQEVLKIWEAEKATMILVTHDIDEAVFLGDRVVIMSNRPGTIKRIIPVDLPRPRDRGSYEFTQVRSAIYAEFFRQEEKPFAYEI